MCSHDDEVCSRTLDQLTIEWTLLELWTKVKFSCFKLFLSNVLTLITQKQLTCCLKQEFSFSRVSANVLLACNQLLWIIIAAGINRKWKGRSFKKEALSSNPVDLRHRRPSDQFLDCWVNSEFRCVIAWREKDGVQFSGAGLGPHEGGPRTAKKKSDCNLCLESANL